MSVFEKSNDRSTPAQFDVPMNIDILVFSLRSNMLIKRQNTSAVLRKFPVILVRLSHSDDCLFFVALSKP